ncbi:S-adenosyl-L-methionine-dependent methyltransferase [Aspergillus pseudodeflectus]|uniref:S-adenosyl-L-methionine-dependent methyltransferase n=1 Tax=Aspergillus pseudodeflectus TaxID=176178 RepID=A0ABR4K4Q4_9EURO
MSVAGLLQNINSVTETLPGQVSEGDRLALLTACDKLRAALEVPMETTMRVTGGVYESAALITAINMGLIDAGVTAAATQPTFTISQLAEVTSADPLLIVDVATFKSTPLAQACATGSPFKEIAIHLASHGPAAALLPDYFAEKGYISPNDTYDSPFQYAMRTKLHYFDYVGASPRLQHALNTVMSTCPGNLGQDWFEYYPVKERLRVDDPSHVLFVDIGGNTGGDVATFKKRFPDLPGRVILQDLFSVIEGAQTSPAGVESMGHDFFTPQPVKGAKAYYLRLVIHDWPDKQAKIILEHIRDAMAPDSILLLNETLVPESGVPLYDAEMDMTMMVVFGSLNRSEAQFLELLDAVGFEVARVCKPEVVIPGSTALFEAVLKK